MKKPLRCLLFALSFLFFGLFPTRATNEDLKSSTNVIPVAMATDDNYIYPTAVTMISILENKNENTTIDFNLMLSGKVSEQNKERLKKFETLYNNCQINLIDMKDAFSNVSLSRKRLSIASYYRLNLPSLLPDCDKIIYLDSDMIVTKDLSEMYNTDLGDNYLAGTIDLSLYRSFKSSEKLRKGHCQKLGIPDVNNYVNAGALILNLKKLREDDMETVFHHYLVTHPVLRYNDQDVLNATCYGKIKVLLKKYNVFCGNYITDLDKMTPYSCDDPTVIHYVGDEKPWLFYDCNAQATWEKYSDDVIQKIYDGQHPLKVVKKSMKKEPIQKAPKKQQPVKKSQPNTKNNPKNNKNDTKNAKNNPKNKRKPVVKQKPQAKKSKK